MRETADAPVMTSRPEIVARDLALMRAVEGTDRTRQLWSDTDRDWATRAAAELVTGAASERDFLVQRAALTRARLVERHPALRRVLDALTWPGWLDAVIVLFAFAAGLWIDRIADDGRINLLAPPVLGLCAWNLAVYAVLLARALRKGLRRARPSSGPLRSLVVAIAQRTARVRRPSASVAAAIAAFTSSWSARIAPLHAARAARILHVAAALLACGVLVGLYLRGLAFEYRASWQSTFLDPAQVHALLRVVLAPGAWLTGLPLPTVEHVAALRSSIPGAGENAASWVHLYAATVVLIVVAPRIVLALIAWTVERTRRLGLTTVEKDAYHARLLRMFREGPLKVVAVPYSFTITDAARAALESLLLRAFGRSDLIVRDAVPYGGEDALAADLVPAGTHLVLPVFNLTATPESAAHGAYLARVAAVAGAHADCVAVVDEAAFRARWPGDAARLEQRREAWRELGASRRVRAVFVDFAELDLDNAAAALEAAVEQRETRA